MSISQKSPDEIRLELLDRCSRKFGSKITTSFDINKDFEIVFYAGKLKCFVTLYIFFSAIFLISSIIFLSNDPNPIFFIMLLFFLILSFPFARSVYNFVILNKEILSISSKKIKSPVFLRDQYIEIEDIEKISCDSISIPSALSTTNYINIKIRSKIRTKLLFPFFSKEVNVLSIPAAMCGLDYLDNFIFLMSEYLFLMTNGEFDKNKAEFSGEKEFSTFSMYIILVLGTIANLIVLVVDLSIISR